MTPAAILNATKAEGVNLALSGTGTIKATGDGVVVNRWLPLIREQKAGIIAALQEAANDSTTHGQYEAAREAFEERAAIIEFDGGLSRAEAERLATESLGVMPPSNQPAEQVALPKQRPAPGQACQDCQHFARPGLSDGYCAERTDLPLAYGQNHPLHELPGDKGASCDKWQIVGWLVGYDHTACKPDRSVDW